MPAVELCMKQDRICGPFTLEMAGVQGSGAFHASISALQGRSKAAQFDAEHQ